MSLMRLSNFQKISASVSRFSAVRMMSKDNNSAGDKLTQKANADQNQYFRQLERQQLLALKKHHDNEIKEHEEDIARLQRKIKEHKERLGQLKQHE